MPEAFVVERAGREVPPAPVFDQVTVRPAVVTGLLFESAS